MGKTASVSKSAEGTSRTGPEGPVPRGRSRETFGYFGFFFAELPGTSLSARTARPIAEDERSGAPASLPSAACRSVPVVSVQSKNSRVQFFLSEEDEASPMVFVVLRFCQTCTVQGKLDFNVGGLRPKAPARAGLGPCAWPYVITCASCAMFSFAVWWPCNSDHSALLGALLIQTRANEKRRARISSCYFRDCRRIFTPTTYCYFAPF